VRLDAGAHFGQRLHDALHGAAGERFIAKDAGVEGLGRENAGKHANGGAGVAGVECGGGLAQAIEAFAVDDEPGAGPFDFDAEGAHAAERGMAIGAGGVVGDAGGALGDGGDHRVAVGDGFVTGERDVASNGGGGRDGLPQRDSLSGSAFGRSFETG